jgi:hypothetical protein
MKTLVATIGLAVALLAGVAAQAMPLAPLNQDQAGGVTKVYGGCGPGGHRGPYGACRPLFSCPPGWHSGPYGRRCFRNW